MQVKAGFWKDNATGDTEDVIVNGSPICSPCAIIGIGMAIGGVLLATCSGWIDGCHDTMNAGGDAVARLAKRNQ